MTLTLRPMNEDEFGPWYAGQFVGYEEQLTEFARMPLEAARRKAKADLSSLLGERGLATEGHSIYVLDDEGKSVGDLWVHEQERAGERFLWVYDVTVDPDQRGRGYGRQAMLLAEEEARRRGLPAVRLNVFGGNAIARSLYGSLGYSEDAVWMSKHL
jgi:ribosomal protein S18 acetylase RimI-like enzyme